MLPGRGAGRKEHDAHLQFVYLALDRLRVSAAANTYTHANWREIDFADFRIWTYGGGQFNQNR